MAEQNPVYFRLGYDESLESKKSLLSSELSLLNIIKTARRYNFLRTEELRLKFNAYKAIKKLGILTRKTRSTLPSLKISSGAKKEKSIQKKGVIITKQRFDEGLESQLREIQEKLKSIEK